MKKLLLIFLPFILFISCEDTGDDEAAVPTLVGSWNYTITEYDQTCAGEGDVWETGTMIFTESSVSIAYTETFESWCDGTVTGDVCDEDGYTYNISEFEEECDGTYTTSGCSVNETHQYTFTSDSVTVNLTESIEISESQASDCDAEGGTYANGNCTFSYDMGPYLVTFDGNTASWNEVVSGGDNESPYCDVYMLTKQ